ncbi:MMPL family transporter [Actinoplanes sp. N902-109]|uniref:MMPL family transporter n=1 Tax=Actinoplanes sp. (strain N902-109) TaxID=649831 RepID=UPI0003293539|nr:MMPL family transporter [Actinoplanes sp. N902-109]AGL18739.1 MMPL domain-containing protein [Actinoplanes sp. N902-109]
MAATLARIGAFCARRRWLVLAAWLAVLLVMAGLAARFAQPLDDELTLPGLQSTQTLDRVDSDFGGGDDGGRVVVAAPPGQTLAGYRPAMTALGQALGAQLQLSGDGRIGYFEAARAPEPALNAARAAGLQVEESSALAAPPGRSSSPGIGLLIALVVLIVTFGSLTAAGMPLLTAVLGLGVALAGLYAGTALAPVNSVAPTLAVLLGLAVGIDYALFLIDRHRRQLRDGAPEVRASIAQAVGTAGSAVLFAALTVIVALAGLTVAGIGFLTQMGLAAAGAVLVAMLMALTLTPALLSFAGRHVIGRTLVPVVRVAPRWSGFLVRHPAAAVVASVLMLAVLAVPVLSMRLGLPNDGNDPTTATDRRAYDLVAEGFGPGANGPLLVLATFGSAPAAARTSAVTARLGAVPGVARVLPAGVHRSDVLFQVIPASGPSDAATATLVTRLRSLDVGVPLLVTGETAVAIDISEHLAHALPGYLGLVAGFAFVLLLLVFRSVLIPVKAVLSFLLSLGAALGCTVAIFQWGRLGGVFGVDPAGPLLSFLPIIVIGVLFGLSMDYEMFLVSGMHEEHRRGAAAQQAVTGGFARGAKVVTAAALIMIGVFGGGVAGGDAVTRPMAFALAMGVLVDAFVVRLVLVPAAISLLGRAAWWLPVWLDRTLPRLDVEGRATRLADGAPPQLHPTGPTAETAPSSGLT